MTDTPTPERVGELDIIDRMKCHGAIESLAAHEAFEYHARLFQRAMESHERLRAEIEAEERACLEVIDERDAAHDAIRDIHIALGGDGEWCGRLPPQAPPHSGDLRHDALALAKALRAEIEALTALVRELEWSATWDGESWCPSCGGHEEGSWGYHEQGHRPDCRLRARLAATGETDAD